MFVWLPLHQAIVPICDCRKRSSDCTISSICVWRRGMCASGHWLSPLSNVILSKTACCEKHQLVEKGKMCIHTCLMLIRQALCQQHFDRHQPHFTLTTYCHYRFPFCRGPFCFSSLYKRQLFFLTLSFRNCTNALWRNKWRSLWPMWWCAKDAHLLVTMGDSAATVYPAVFAVKPETAICMCISESLCQPACHQRDIISSMTMTTW